ncbi:hypothetical protein C5167_044478 [Papaver somniferum]|uniref:DUF4408 domain-containing protein n=1 Tax=Papaver somniferum TaxID=3469 RepID=A0A4Y7L8M9_PAPSO|nr:uncharacterized protein LOC113318576 [Papaver somniferum]RZC81894.1 hypothetical protein C5167_044478 [Papaver somniferum]
MAVMRKNSSSNWAFSLKVLLISTGVLSMAIILKLSIPVVLEIIISEAPVLWSSILCWLTPPYLYVIINGIIITIAASSRFHQNKNDGNTQEFKPLLVPVNNTIISAPAANNFVGYDDTMMMMMNMKNSMEIRTEFEGMIGYDRNHQVVGFHEQQHHGVAEKNQISNGMFGFGYDHHHHHEVAVKNTNLVEFEDSKPKVYHVYEQKQEEQKLTIPERKMKNRVVLNDDFSHDEKENSFMISRSSWTPPIIRTDSMENIQIDNEKPPASSRFNHKKSVKASPEGGKTLGVTKPKRHETLETTWKTITDGRSMPLTRHLKKSDTWEARHHQQDQLTPKLMKKSETFTERHHNNNESSDSSSGKLRKNTHKKEPSLSQDDLNRRVEAFINKFNEEMRLQRQESLNQYNEMVRQR